MQVPSSTKTEQRAVNALEAIIDEHSTMVHQFNGNDKDILFGKYVLLGNKIKAQKYFEQFSEEDQSRYKGFPIYKLYGQL